MTSVVTLVKGARKVILDNSPSILTGIAVAGVVSTAIMAVRVTPLALASLQEEALKRIEDGDGSFFISMFTPWERIQLTWKHYIPAAAIGGMTIACVIGANSINTRRQAALIGAYSLTETAFKEYREKIAETIGAGKEQKVRDILVQERIDANPVSTREVIITGNGNVLCYDTLSGRYFESDMESLRKAQNDINALTINEMYASQNDFYRAVGLPINGYGEEFGWTTDVMLELSFSTALSEDNRPCIAINYRMSPIRGYHKFG